MHHGGRPYTAWWLKYEGREERAIELLKRFTPAIERQIDRLERSHHGEVDWAPVIWDAAYRAAWACNVPGFWPILKKTIWWTTAKHIATHNRRLAKLRRVPLTARQFKELEA